MLKVNSQSFDRGVWGSELKGRDNLIILKQKFYTIISYPNFLRKLRQTLRVGKEDELYFAHVADIVNLFNSNKKEEDDSKVPYTILNSLQYYLENAFLDPNGELVVNDLIDCIYTDKQITFDKYRFLVRTTLELFEEVSQLEIAEKKFDRRPVLNNRGRTLLTLEDELQVLFNKLGLKGMVTLAEVLSSIIYIKD